jgi:hypothetical protein
MSQKRCRAPKPIPDRPGYHAYRVEDGKIIYMEDQIMEMELGRKLRIDEEVRHKNGNTLDNRRSNLEVVTVVREDK